MSGIWCGQRWVGDDIPIARILVHPEPAWASRADDTVLTFVLAPGKGQLPWEEELPIRRVDAETGEICCVPFLQTRLALGDVERVNSGGYTAAVTRPSGCTRLRSWEREGRLDCRPTLRSDQAGVSLL
ncbi:hypothetical protein ACIA5D_20620 [Actinoplanes sp. NPDC051513]|uniref:hypothetical protein n=1 Tax=Actinoplanes sp. NPDC051513 TaxID=3363908 RepID=UPI0037A63022